MKKPKIILTLILASFFIKGLFLASVFPIFQAPDEQTHYATIQSESEPTEKTWPIKKAIVGKDARNIATYNFSEEITQTAQATNFGDVILRPLVSQNFSTGDNGEFEKTISSGNLKKYIDTYPASITRYPPLFHKIIGTAIEKSLQDENIFIRFFSIRVFMVLLGTLTILLSFFIFKTIGFSEKNSLLLSAVLAFQPQFSATSAIINPDILLIFTFSLFTFGAVLIIRDGFETKSTIIALLGILLGMMTKAPALILVAIFVLLILFKLYKKFEPGKKQITASILLGLALLTIGFFLIPKELLNKYTRINSKSHFSSPVESISKYAEKTINVDGLKNTLQSYWGNFGWLDTRISENILEFIWIIEIIALIGLVFFLYKKENLTFLPQKKYIFLFATMIFLLQFAIRFNDWSSFNVKGNIEYGTPGRYFMPNIMAHFVLLFTGLGFLVRKKEYFEIMLKITLVLMILLQIYSIFNIIIPRYYL